MAIRQHIGNLYAGRAGLGAVARHPSLGGDPDVTVAVLEQIDDRVAHQAILPGQGLEDKTIVVAYPAGSGEPQMPLPVLQNGVYSIAPQAVFGGEGFETGTVVAADAVAGAEPQISGGRHVTCVQNVLSVRGWVIPQINLQLRLACGRNRRGVAGGGKASYEMVC